MTSPLRASSFPGEVAKLSTTFQLQSRSSAAVVRGFAIYSLVFRSIGAGAALAAGIPWLVLVQVLGMLLYGLATLSGLRRRTGLFLCLLGPEWTLWGSAMVVALGARPFLHVHTIVVTSAILLLLHEFPASRRLTLFLIPLVLAVPFLILLRSAEPLIELATTTEDLLSLINQVVAMGFLTLVSGFAMFDHARARRFAEERAEDQTRLVEDLSHELRTPLATILTAAQGARTSTGVSAPVDESLAWIEDAARSSGRLVKKMLDLATLERGRRFDSESVELGAAIRVAMDRLRPLAEERSIELRLSADLKTGRRVDAVSLGIVLRNLVSNAIHHSRPGKVVEVRLIESDGADRIEVEDRGEGIAPQNIPLIFERMWRSDRVRSREHDRFGLGLSIAQRHAELLDATIEVRSEVGEGSVFSLVFRRDPAI